MERTIIATKQCLSFCERLNFEERLEKVLVNTQHARRHVVVLFKKLHTLENVRAFLIRVWVYEYMLYSPDDINK